MLRTLSDFGKIDRWPPSLSEVLDALGLGAGATIIKTSSSWVILDQRHAYKLKRVADGAEFEEPERRRIWCSEERWRNERFAPGVYQGLIALARGRNDSLRMGSKGINVEWIIKMRRLSAKSSLSALIRQREIPRTQIMILAQTLTKFYIAGPPQHDQIDQLLARLHRRIQEATNTLLQSLEVVMRSRVLRLQGALLQFLQSARVDFNARVCDGRIVDGHGALMPEHIFLDRQPAIIGALVCKPGSLKLDAIDDLCLLAMECEHAGRADIGAVIMATYGQAASDDAPPSLVAFYKALHACERAAGPVTPSRQRWCHQPTARSKTSEYLAQATNYAMRARDNPAR